MLRQGVPGREQLRPAESSLFGSIAKDHMRASPRIAQRMAGATESPVEWVVASCLQVFSSVTPSCRPAGYFHPTPLRWLFSNSLTILTFYEQGPRPRSGSGFVNAGDAHGPE